MEQEARTAFYEEIQDGLVVWAGEKAKRKRQQERQWAENLEKLRERF